MQQLERYICFIEVCIIVMRIPVVAPPEYEIGLITQDVLAMVTLCS